MTHSPNGGNPDLQHFLHIPPAVWALAQWVGVLTEASVETQGENMKVEASLTEMRIELANYLAQRRAIWGIK